MFGWSVCYAHVFVLSVVIERNACFHHPPERLRAKELPTPYVQPPSPTTGLHQVRCLPQVVQPRWCCDCEVDQVILSIPLVAREFTTLTQTDCNASE